MRLLGLLFFFVVVFGFFFFFLVFFFFQIFAHGIVQRKKIGPVL